MGVYTFYIVQEHSIFFDNSVEFERLTNIRGCHSRYQALCLDSSEIAGKKVVGNQVGAWLRGQR